MEEPSTDNHLLEAEVNHLPVMTETTEMEAITVQEDSNLIDDDAKINEIDRAAQKYPNVIKESGPFITGVDILSTEEQARAAKRAERFGLKTNHLMNTENEEIVTTVHSELPILDIKLTDIGSLNPIEPQADTRKRMNVLHVYGTDKLSTEDIFAHFRDYGPRNLEWIDDSSCNVVFEDTSSAKRALHFLGTHRLATPEDKILTETSEDPTPMDDTTNTEQASNDWAHLDDPIDLIEEEQNNKPTLAINQRDSFESLLERGNQLFPVDTPFVESNPSPELSFWRIYTVPAQHDPTIEEETTTTSKHSHRRKRKTQSTTTTPKYLALRFACITDLKNKRGAAQQSRYYKKHGRPGQMPVQDRLGKAVEDPFYASSSSLNRGQPEIINMKNVFDRLGPFRKRRRGDDNDDDGGGDQNHIEDHAKRMELERAALDAALDRRAENNTGDELTLESRIGQEGTLPDTNGEDGVNNPWKNKRRRGRGFDRPERPENVAAMDQQLEDYRNSPLMFHDQVDQEGIHDTSVDDASILGTTRISSSNRRQDPFPQGLLKVEAREDNLVPEIQQKKRKGRGFG